MKKYIVLFSILLGIMACEESELTNFSEPDAIYFQLEKTDSSFHYSYWDDWLNYRGDSLDISFGAFPEDHEAYQKVDTFWLQVNLLGNIAEQDRSFKVVVNEHLTNAVEGTHYKAVNDEYIFPKNSVCTFFPLIFYNDSSLGEKPYTLALELVENDDFILGLEGRTNVRFHIYDDVVMPPIWDLYIYRHLGPYSKAKHRVILLTNGGKVLPTTREEYSAQGGYYNIYYMRKPMNDYLEANEVYDENGIRIEPW